MPEDQQPKGKTDILLKLRASRKSLIVEYICAGFLLFLLIIARARGVYLAPFFQGLVLAIAILAFLSAELIRYFGDRYVIMRHKLIIIKGIIRLKKKNIYYHPLGFIPDINVKQSAIQRILHYGTIYVKVGNSKFEIKKINNPHKIMDMIEDLIDGDRSLVKEVEEVPEVH